MDWNTFYNFPVSYRRWIIKRLNKEVKAAQEQGGIQNPPNGRMKSADKNDMRRF